MKLAVCMPVYNASHRIEASIKSIITQTYSEFVFIITDDCSTDDTYDKLSGMKDSRIKLFRNQENLGTVNTRNNMLHYCIDNGFEYMAVMDADDIAYPDRFEKQIKILEDDPSLAVCGSSMLIERTRGVWSAPENPSSIKVECLFGNPIPTSTATIRLRFMKQFGLEWNNSFMPCADYHLWYKMLYEYNLRAKNTGSVDMVYSYSPKGVSHGKGLSKQEEKDLLVKKLILQNIRVNYDSKFMEGFMKVALCRSANPCHAVPFYSIAMNIMLGKEISLYLAVPELQKRMALRASSYLKKVENIDTAVEKSIKKNLILHGKWFSLVYLEILFRKVKYMLDGYSPYLSYKMTELYFVIKRKFN